MNSSNFRQYDELGEITIEGNLFQAKAIINSNASFGFPVNFRRDCYLQYRKYWDTWPKPTPANKRKL
ncbi:MAG: hypothetical protein AABY22_19190 [Nanoarchaeota archaeon]